MAVRRGTIDEDSNDSVRIDLNDQALLEPSRKSNKRPAWLTKAFTSTLLHDFKKERKGLPIFELFERFNQVVGLQYKGDSLSAGVHTSCLSCQLGDKPLYYAAVHRFPPGEGRQKRIVASWKDVTMEAAIRNLVDIWLEAIKTEGPDGSTTVGSPFGKPQSQREVPAAHRDLTDLLEQSIRNLK